MSYFDDRLKNSLNYQNDRLEKLIKKYDDLELSFNNKMLVSNYKSTLFLTKISVILSILAIIITLYFSYKQELNNDNENIKNSIINQTNEIEHQTNILKQILDSTNQIH